MDLPKAPLEAVCNVPASFSNQFINAPSNFNMLSEHWLNSPCLPIVGFVIHLAAYMIAFAKPAQRWFPREFHSFVVQIEAFASKHWEVRTVLGCPNHVKPHCQNNFKCSVHIGTGAIGRLSMVLFGPMITPWVISFPV